MTPPDSNPTAPPTVAPASDEEISGYGGEIAIYQRGVDRYLHCVQCDASPGSMGGHRPGCDFTVWPRIKARIEADRAEVSRLRARVAELEEMYGELQDWVGEQMTPPDVVEDALVQIVAKAEHFIPPHAYGDNVAACEFANLLEQIHSIARAALKPEPARGSEKP